MIGDKPKTLYTLSEIRNMDFNQIVDVLEDNNWFDIIGKGSTLTDWMNIDQTTRSLIIHTKMNEWRQQTQKTV